MNRLVKNWLAWPLGWAFLLLAKPAWAHAFGKLYTLPVPVWLYMYGTSMALLLSMVVLGLMVKSGNASVYNAGLAIDLSANTTKPALPPLSEVGAPITSGLTLLCIATGWFGQSNPYFNINMTLFWVVFLLGGLYWSACFGDWYAKVNPFRYVYLQLVRFRQSTRTFSGRFANEFNRKVGELGDVADQSRHYPHLTEWPAVFALVGLIWVELMLGVSPAGLAWLLAAYVCVNVIAAWYWGPAQWFSKGELFAVLFRFAGKMAPQWTRQSKRGNATKPATSSNSEGWFIGLLQAPPPSLVATAFIVFLLSSTAFDGVKSITQWSEFYWGPVVGFIQPYTGLETVKAYPFFKSLGVWFNTAGMLLLWAAYGSAYLMCLWFMRQLVPTRYRLRELARLFAWSLLPIALVYHVAHYYTLLFSQGVQLLRLAVDPFGFGWNPFGIKAWLPSTWVLNASFVWHSQVAVILFGHVVGVYVAHVQALRLYSTHKQAMKSQLPMLLLMMGLTSFGLWLMAQPVMPGEGF